MRTEIVSALTASILIHAAGMATVDTAVLRFERSHELLLKRQRALQRYEGTQFDFVESPAENTPDIPPKKSRISDRDSVSRDFTADKENALPQAPPRIDTQGPADQLAQKRFDPSRLPSPGASPSTPRPAVPEQQAPPEQPAQPSAPAPEDAGEQAKKPSPDEMVLAKPAVQPRPAQPPSQASPALTPSAASPSSAGMDKVTTQEVSRARSHGAQVYGKTSFDATGSGMGAYIRGMKEKIWLAWFPYLAFHYPKDFRAADAVIAFKLDKDGRLMSVSVAESDGSGLFAAFCVEAVQRAAPFGPLPEEILDLTGKDELEAQFAFHFW